MFKIFDKRTLNEYCLSYKLESPNKWQMIIYKINTYLKHLRESYIILIKEYLTKIYNQIINEIITLKRI